MEGQDEFIIMRKSDNADVGLGEDYEEVLADVVGCNAELCVVNQEAEAQTFSVRVFE